MIDSFEEKPWHKSYRIGPNILARSLAPYPKLPLYSILDRSASKNPLSTAIEYNGVNIKYAELKKYSDCLAAALSKLGVRRGDKVITVLPNCPQSIISTFAILKTGAVFVPGSILQKEPELEHEIEVSGAKTMICLTEYPGSLRSIISNTNLKNIILTSINDYTPKQSAQAKRIKGSYQFRNLIAKFKPIPPKVKINVIEDLAYLAFTGGATGTPKGVMLTHYNRLANVMQGWPWMMANYEKKLRGRGSVIIPVPLFHSYGDWVMLSAIYWGLKIILVQDPRDIDAILKLMIKNRPFLVSIVPTQLMKLQEKNVPQMHIKVMSGASHLPADLGQSFYEDTKMPVSEGYGLTEAGPVTHINLSGFSRSSKFLNRRKQGIGVPVPDTAVKLINEETGKSCAVGEEGQMYIKGPQVMKGYWPKPGSGLVNGWLPTGDIARMDKDGYFFLVDRIKDMVNVSGYKVYTSVIDDILFKHHAVLSAAAIGVPDREKPGSERVKAFIQLKREYRGKVSEKEIIEFCQDKCPPYAVPKFIEFVKELPLTATQKIYKRKLREEELAKM